MSADCRTISTAISTALADLIESCYSCALFLRRAMPPAWINHSIKYPGAAEEKCLNSDRSFERIPLAGGGLSFRPREPSGPKLPNRDVKTRPPRFERAVRFVTAKKIKLHRRYLRSATTASRRTARAGLLEWCPTSFRPSE